MNIKMTKKEKQILSTFVALILGMIISLTVLRFTPNKSIVIPKQEVILTDTMPLENEGSVDIYKTETGNYLVISLDDYKYIIKKNRRARKLASDLEALFERLELPEKEPVKPEVK